MEKPGPANKPSDAPFKIGRWLVSPSLNKIQSGDETVTLVPRVMELLVCLAQKSPLPVSQDELFEAIWPNQVVSDSSLYQAVAQLRKALGDTGKTKHYLERVSGKGYRLIKSIELVRPEQFQSEEAQSEEAQSDEGQSIDIQSSSSEVISDQSTAAINQHGASSEREPVGSEANQFDLLKAEKSLKTGVQNNKGWIRTTLVFLFILSLPLVYLGVTHKLGFKANEESSRPVLTEYDIKQAQSIALIRLETQQVDDHHQSRLEALNDVLLTQLGLASGIKVISLNQRLDEPGVDLYLAGRVLTEGEQVRLFLRLETVTSREVVWARLFTGNIDSLFDFQDEITRGLLELLDKKQNNPSLSQQSIDPKVFDQYLIARHLWEKRKAAPLIQAQKILEDLRDRQVLFPLAAVALCETYHFLYLYSDWDLSDATERCRPLLDLALEREPNLGQALAAKALLLSSSGERDAAKLTFEKAIELSPNYALAYLWYGNLLRNKGEYRRALKMSQKAYELAPMSPVVNRSLAYSHLNLREVKQAKYFYDRALALEPNYIHRAISDLDFFPLTFERASAFITWANNNPRVFQRQSVYKLNLAQVWLALGELDKVAKIVAEFEDNGLNPQFTLYVKASLLIQRGEFELAAETFQQRITLEMEKERVFVPYAQALDWAGNTEQAYQQYIDWFPFLDAENAEITDDAIFHFMYFIPLKQKVYPQWGWQELANRVDQKLAQKTYPDTLQIAEWQAFKGNLESARSIVQKMMADGWLPDTNSEPFAYHRMDNLFKQVGLGEAEFRVLLQRNREAAISNLSK